MSVLFYALFTCLTVFLCASLYFVLYPLMLIFSMNYCMNFVLFVCDTAFCLYLSLSFFCLLWCCLCETFSLGHIEESNARKHAHTHTHTKNKQITKQQQQQHTHTKEMVQLKVCVFCIHVVIIMKDIYDVPDLLRNMPVLGMYNK